MSKMRLGYESELRVYVTLNSLTLPSDSGAGGLFVMLGANGEMKHSAS